MNMNEKAGSGEGSVRWGPCLDCNYWDVRPAYLRRPKDCNFVEVLNDGHTQIAPAKSHYLIVRCKRCQSIYLHPNYFRELEALYDDPQYWEAFYPHNIHTASPQRAIDNRIYLSWLAWRNKRDASRYLRMANLDRGAVVLELGCGRGELLDGFRAWGCRTYGIELSFQANEAMRRGHTVVRGDIVNSELPHEKIDLVVAIDVLEHIPDLRKLVERVSEILRPGGLFISKVPNDIEGYRKFVFRKIWWMIPPFHVRYFHPGYDWKSVLPDRMRVVDIYTCGAVGADLGRVLWWVLKTKLGMKLGDGLAWKCINRGLVVGFLPIDWVLNTLRKHSEAILVMEKWK